MIVKFILHAIGKIWVHGRVVHQNANNLSERPKPTGWGTAVALGSTKSCVVHLSFLVASPREVFVVFNLFLDQLDHFNSEYPFPFSEPAKITWTFELISLLFSLLFANGETSIGVLLKTGGLQFFFLQNFHKLSIALVRLNPFLS